MQCQCMRNAYANAHMLRCVQGDSELDGTGIETSITGDFRITLMPKASLPPHLQPINAPILENSNEFVLHGFTYTDCAPVSHIFGPISPGGWSHDWSHFFVPSDDMLLVNPSISCALERMTNPD